MVVVAILFHRADGSAIRPAAQARARVINRLIIGRFLGGIVAAMDRKCELLRRAFTRANCCISDPRRGLSLSPLACNWIAFFVTARKDPIVWGRARFSRPGAVVSLRVESQSMNNIQRSYISTLFASVFHKQIFLLSIYTICILFLSKKFLKILPIIIQNYCNREQKSSNIKKKNQKIWRIK